MRNTPYCPSLCVSKLGLEFKWVNTILLLYPPATRPSLCLYQHTSARYLVTLCHFDPFLIIQFSFIRIHGYYFFFF
ncbi:hypothetical protein CISIN_1g035040mg [Citrus sinensis]|uniref:Uncharacterized protein n=1 Tax=Citrus sinensis TaxID=2711 RepID=A0A067H592_CITSI|nr:hypothetical protein CISIN_1g035040mg [Citrus sinensis]